MTSPGKRRASTPTVRSFRRRASARRAWTCRSRACGATTRSLISLANTGEPLFIVNRSGNRPSHEGAPAALDQAIASVPTRGLQRHPVARRHRLHHDGAPRPLGRRRASGSSSATTPTRASWIARKTCTSSDYEELVRRAHARSLATARQAAARQAGDRRGTRLPQQAPGLARTPPSSTIEPRKAKQHLPHRRPPQDIVEEYRGQLSCRHRLPVLLLRHQRPHADAGGGHRRVERPLQPGEPHRAAQERCARAARSAQHARTPTGRTW